MAVGCLAEVAGDGLSAFGYILNRLVLAPGQDAGLVCAQAAMQGAPLLALPLSACWTAKAARACPALSAAFACSANGDATSARRQQENWIVLHLLHEQHHCRGQPEARQRHLSLLKTAVPQKCDLCGQDEAKARFTAFCEELSDEVMLNLGIDEDSYLWAQQVLQRFGLCVYDCNGSATLLLAPGFELLETEAHAAAPGVLEDTLRIEHANRDSSDVGELLVLYAARSYEPGDRPHLSRRYRMRLGVPANGGDEVDNAGAFTRLGACSQVLEEYTSRLKALRSTGVFESPDDEAFASELLVLRACVRGFPEGDPGAEEWLPKLRAGDPEVAAYRRASAAVLMADLAIAERRVASYERAVQHIPELRPVLAELFVRVAQSRIRCLDFMGAHQALVQSLALVPAREHVVALAYFCAEHLSSRSQRVLNIDLGDGTGVVLMASLRHKLLSAGYVQAEVLRALGLTSIEHLIDVDGEQLERQLGWIDSDEHDTEAGQAPLAVLIRLFLLRSMLSLGLVRALLGVEEFGWLLAHGVFSIFDNDTAQLLDSGCASCLTAEPGTVSSTHVVFANVALWPVEEDMLIATDFYDTVYVESEFEPVMYLGADSYALIAGSPRVPAAMRALDICCGSGVQGLVALRHYAQHATFLDLNPRALRFTDFNALLNGMRERCTYVHGDIGDPALVSELHSRGQFDVILANPPFLPNPGGTNTAAGAMYSSGGDDGERVYEALVSAAARCLLEPGGRLCAVSVTPNAEDFAARVESWVCHACGDMVPSLREGILFRGSPTPIDKVLKYPGRSLEQRRYVSNCRRLGLRSMSPTLLLMRCLSPGTVSDQSPVHVITREEHPNLFADPDFLRVAVRQGLEFIEISQFAPEAQL